MQRYKPGEVAYGMLRQKGQNLKGSLGYIEIQDQPGLELVSNIF